MLDQLVEKLRPALLKQARLLCGNRHDGEDLLQDVFLYATLKERALTSHPAPEKWFGIVLRNKFIDWKRRGRRQIPADEMDAVLAVDLQTSWWMDGEELEKALRSLPREHQEVVRLHLEGLRFREIAVRLGCSTSKANKLHHEARRLLGEYLKQKGKDF